MNCNYLLGWALFEEARNDRNDTVAIVRAFGDAGVHTIRHPNGSDNCERWISRRRQKTTLVSSTLPEYVFARTWAERLSVSGLQLSVHLGRAPTGGFGV